MMPVSEWQMAVDYANAMMTVMHIVLFTVTVYVVGNHSTQFLRDFAGEDGNDGIAAIA